MLLCETAGLTAAARQIALAAMQAVDAALPIAEAREHRRSRLAANLFAYCLQAGNFEVRPAAQSQQLPLSCTGLEMHCS